MNKRPFAVSACVAVLAISLMSGCTPQSGPGQHLTNSAASDVTAAPDAIVQVQSASYNANHQIVTVTVTTRNVPARFANPPAGHGASTTVTPRAPQVTGENVLDVTNQNGIVNYATAQFPGKPVRWVRVITIHGHSMTNKAPFMVPVPNEARSINQTGARIPTQVPAGSPASPGAMAAGYAGGIGLPPGVSLDPSIAPLANIGAPRSVKLDAVLRIARNKLGTPYIWGHNEDRGQYGFDCSNFTAYVYHHALGYVISSLSVVQYRSVGYPTSRNNLQPGDLLVFENGAHVGIYVGNGQMIDAGGGKGKVSYMTIGPGSYWGQHISVIKRMF